MFVYIPFQPTLVWWVSIGSLKWTPIKAAELDRFSIEYMPPPFFDPFSVGTWYPFYLVEKH